MVLACHPFENTFCKYSRRNLNQPNRLEHTNLNVCLTNWFIDHFYLITFQDEEAVEKYRSDSVVLKNHIKNLHETTVEFRGTICDTCHQPLSMPALYFLCQHAYHQEWVMLKRNVIWKKRHHIQNRYFSVALEASPKQTKTIPFASNVTQRTKK